MSCAFGPNLCDADLKSGHLVRLVVFLICACIGDYIEISQHIILVAPYCLFIGVYKTVIGTAWWFFL